ncbi:MAG: hypothetical protein EON93_00300 [Burkholderiales bacterium]|nr:MAG: hypothetical protein EON93_00300 [Burkholderiales bacterium]
MIHRIFLVAFWFTLVFAFVMALLPHPPMVPGAPTDKVQHIAAFATLTALGRAAFRDMPPLRLLAYLAAFGALIEIMQAMPALRRSSDIIDWIADVASVLITLGVVAALRLGLRYD